MSNKLITNYVKRIQRDYSLSLKLQIVSEIELGKLGASEAQLKYGIQGRGTISNWLRKYGNFDWENKTPTKMPKTPEQKIMELEAKVKLLEKQKKRLEKQADISDKKSIIFDMMVDIAEKNLKYRSEKSTYPNY